MLEFDKIYLSWRAGRGSGRHIVGVLSKSTEGVFSFKYFPNAAQKAMQFGFSPYTELPNIDIQYNGASLDIFAQRLTRSERPDIQKFYDFWEIEPKDKNDKFYLLGHTQGLLPSDNFEFLADYKPVPGLHFVTELASLSQLNLPANTLIVGDELSVELDENNEFDQYAVKVFKGKTLVGYIKKIHSRLFYKTSIEHLKITVKAIDSNGTIKRVFLKVAKTSG